MSIMEGALSQVAPMNNPVSSPTHPLSDGILHTLERLRSLSQISVQAGWHYFDGDLPIDAAVNPDSWQSWTVGSVNAKDHHPWIKGRQVRWFARRIQVPPDLQGYPLTGLCLRLGLLWWSEETQVYVNGSLVQEGDLFDCAPRLVLSESVQPGDQFAIALRMVSPIHDDGALMKSVCHYEAFSPDALPEPSFIANELAVLQSYLEMFEPEKLEILATALSEIAWDSLKANPDSPIPSPHHPIPPPSHPPTHHPITLSLSHLRQTLLPLAEPMHQCQIKLVGHAHLDMAWLWTLEETWKAAERTFQSVLTLQQEFPELTFAHTTPALYEWIEQHRPDLFAQIQAQVQAGKWEIVAGFWIEPELNLISGESIARQVLYGQRYLQEKFGKICAIAWVPDTFGFTWQLPQILQQGGVEYFVTQKLRWNDTTKFPYEIFQWQAPDGTQILSLMSAPIGEFIDPVKMANFAWSLEQKTGLQTALWLPGVGDHGGGPTRDMLEVAQRWQRSPFFPSMEFGTALEYLEEIKNQELRTPSFSKTRSSETPLPVWNSELYLEYHRGCYTTHADQKQHNRSAESALYEAELWSSLAAIATHAPYPKAELESAWKATLLNQFHDILPGSSITPVFTEANEAWEAVKFDCWQMTEVAQRSLIQNMALPPQPHPDARLVVVFNPCNWTRTEIVNTDVWLDSNDQRDWQICDLTGTAIAQQHCHRQPGNSLYCIAFVADQIPAIGYRAYWLCPGEVRTESSPDNHPASSQFVLENEFLRVSIDPATGDIASLFDKTQQREVLAAPGNQLQAFGDRGQYWDAWNIDPHYADHPLPSAKLIRIETGDAPFQNDMDQALSAFQQRVYVERQIGQSIFKQTYKLDTGSLLLKIETQVDWQEHHVLVKAAFPLNLEADFATYEIPCGAIQRTTKPKTAAEKAQWEVPALRWADLSDGNYGVSLLNDCKYGYDAQPSQLRLTLLRGSEWPDPEADQGEHNFTYAIYPHAGDWKQAQTVRRGYELNLPLQVVEFSGNKSGQAGTLPAAASLLNLGDQNLVLMAFKQAEEGNEAGNEWILRCYECHGEDAPFTLHAGLLGLNLEGAVDLLERRSDRPIPTSNNQGQTITVCPWKIESFKLSRKRD